ncbi:MAG: fibronectin type III domain-containing protein, partial [Planctomycetota bacterium]
MYTVSACTIIVAMLGAVPGENAGWGTGEVVFQAYVDTDQHHEIFPICAGKYMIEVSIKKVIEDPGDVLGYITSVEVCYDDNHELVSGTIIEVEGTYYHHQSSEIPYYKRVQATSIYVLDELDEEEDEEQDDPEIVDPDIITGSAEPTETTVTLRAVLEDDGGDECMCRFIYRKYDDRYWHTEWITDLYSGAEISQKIAGLIPETLYFYYVEAENSEEYDMGRTGSFVTLAEKVPPIPHPAVWLSGPDQINISSIVMTADIARDVSGPEEYAFDFVASPTGGAGGSDSPWQFYPSYTDVGLNPNHQYGYRVKARDGHGSETAYSPVQYAYSAVEDPAGVEFGEITTSSIQAKSSNKISGLDRGRSGLKLENVTAAQVSSWQRENSFWTSDGLLPNSLYAFRAQARNGDGDHTAFSPLAEIYTTAMEPAKTTFSNVTISRLRTHWSANGNPAGTEFWCRNSVSGANSGWITNTHWLDAGLSPNVRYTYQVKARNGNGVETAFSESVEKYSAIENPTDIAFGAITANSIQVRSENTPSGLDQGQSGLRFENMTAGRMSSWRRDNSFWNSDGLLPNRRYEFLAQARNGDGEQSSYSRIAAAYTHANIPTPAAFAGITTSSIQVQWGSNGNPSGTLYLCENTTAGTNSGWTILTAWNDTALQPNIRYTFHLRAQNAVGATTGITAETHKYSAIETPTGVVFGTITANSIEVKSENTPTGLNSGQSGLRFENVTKSELSAWQQGNNFWTSGGLLPNTSYIFRAQARNGDSDETPYGRTNVTYTMANPPGPADFSYVTDNSIRVNWAPNGNPFGTLYRCQNTTNGADSGWISSTSFDSVDLTPFTTYSFRVKARNSNGVETAWVDLGRQTTGYRSLTVSSTEGGQVDTPGEDVFNYAPGTIVNLRADAQDKYHFIHWSGSAVDAEKVADPNSATTTVIVDAHYNLVANFLRTRIYVDSRAGGANDGSSWENAFTSLQDALDMAQKGNKILVAQGLYTPDIGQNRAAGDYSLSFAIPNGAEVKGGYAGLGQANPDTRDIVTYETILSGDLNADDTRVRDVYDLYGEVSRLDNSLHVVTAHDVGNTTLLDGFTITAGNSHDGAGIQLIRSDIIISECTIEKNRSGRLSGDGLDGWGQGAGISCFRSEPALLACTFRLNFSGAWGGALHSFRSKSTLRDCFFQANHAGLEGGAISFDQSDGIVVDSTFQGNWSTDGGAVFVSEDGECRLTNCRFMGNAGYGSGGAVF